MSSGSLNGSRQARASALLGTDAPLAAGRPRRVPSSKAMAAHATGTGGGKRALGKTAPLLNCTSESRRQASDVASRKSRKPRATAATASRSLLPWALAVAAAAAAYRGLLALDTWPPRAAGWGVVALLAVRYGLCPALFPERAPPVVEEEDDGPLLACWGGRPERAPPWPLPELPETLGDVEEPWMVEAKLPSRWPARERRFLARCRETFAAEFAAAPPYPDVYGDRRLLRALRMDPAGDEDLAVRKVGDYLRWRVEVEADAMRATVPEVGPTPARWPHGDVLFACLRLLQCSDKYFDRNGHAVTVYQAFHWPAPALRAHLCSLPTAALVAFAQMGAEYNGAQMEKISRAREAVILADAKKRFDERKRQGQSVSDPPLLNEGWGEITQLCAVTDMAGCTFGSIMMPTLIPAVVQATKMFLNYYPYIVGRLHIVNCQPTIAAVFRRALTSIVPEHVAKRITVHPIGGRAIFDQVARSHLPEQLGGDAPCPELTPPDPPPDASAGS